MERYRPRKTCLSATLSIQKSHRPARDRVRREAGDQQPEPWHNQTNKRYLRILIRKFSESQGEYEGNCKELNVIICQ